MFRFIFILNVSVGLPLGLFPKATLKFAVHAAQVGFTGITKQVMTKLGLLLRLLPKARVNINPVSMGDFPAQGAEVGLNYY